MHISTIVNTAPIKNENVGQDVSLVRKMPFVSVEKQVYVYINYHILPVCPNLTQLLSRLLSLSRSSPPDFFNNSLDLESTPHANARSSLNAVKNASNHASLRKSINYLTTNYTPAAPIPPSSHASRATTNNGQTLVFPPLLPGFASKIALTCRITAFGLHPPTLAHKWIRTAAFDTSVNV